MEAAKRRLLFSLLRLGLPVVSKQEDRMRGLAFRFLADPDSWEMDDLSQSWLSLRAILNDLNRSMGLNDPYPFVMTPGVLKKLSFIHRLLREKPWLSTGQS